MAFNAGRSERKGFDLPDPTAMAVALYPDIVETSLEAYSRVEYIKVKGLTAITSLIPPT